MTTYRIQVELPYYTNLPSDVAVNTFHVTCLPPLSSGDLTDVCDAFGEFYTFDHTGSTPPVGECISPVVKRNSGACSVTAYDLADAEPRPPLEVRPFTLPAATGTGAIPLEMAACLSMHGTFPPGEVRARRRGRVFIGPLSTTAINAGTASSMPTINSPLRNALVASAQKLKADIVAVNPLAYWSVWSRADNAPVEIVGGWVDDAPDTQRRRGNAPTLRTLW